ncbi:hypothetical protein [Anaerobacillus alkaliphilus]|uniref:hypothetical protein n=1 Tax=Anaerobacillus alkaliphilus TaxID=1548597 RepID=UPI0013758653|nr:hypothetical protein [Anaerobacillus alkaliphilus]
MSSKQVITGFLLFTIVTVGIFLVVHQLLDVNEGISVVVAFIGGIIAEILYRKKNKEN